MNVAITTKVLNGATAVRGAAKRRVTAPGVPVTTLNGTTDNNGNAKVTRVAFEGVAMVRAYQVTVPRRRIDELAQGRDFGIAIVARAPQAPLTGSTGCLVDARMTIVVGGSSRSHPQSKLGACQARSFYPANTPCRNHSPSSIP